VCVCVCACVCVCVCVCMQPRPGKAPPLAKLLISLESRLLQILRQGDWRVWSAYGSSDSSQAFLAVFNTGNGAQSITLPVSLVHLGATCAVRDLWKQQDMGSAGKLSVSAPAHGSQFYLLSKCS
jgi:hypothetical protein